MYNLKKLLIFFGFLKYFYYICKQTLKTNAYEN